jgi:hypothetical protein
MENVFFIAHREREGEKQREREHVPFITNEGQSVESITLTPIGLKMCQDEYTTDQVSEKLIKSQIIIIGNKKKSQTTAQATVYIVYINILKYQQY